MSVQSLQTFNTTILTVGLLAAGFALYKIASGANSVYQAADDTTGEILKGAFDWYYGNGDKSEILHDSLPVNQLGTWHFYSDWTITPEARAIYLVAYEEDMNNMLTSGGVLKPEYRGMIQQGDFATKANKFFGGD